ncbi:MAG: hypothetical protein RLZZ142_2760 [Verrucomicrobiota bacterium]
MQNPASTDFLQNFFEHLLPPDTGHSSVLEVCFSLALSFALNCLIALTYKRTYRGAKYSQDYVHTLLLLGTVVTVVIMIVRGSQSTAFGMFAAFSIIRFRSSVGQARDIGFIFLAMATGLAVGARAYAMVSLTTPILCALIFLLSKADAFAPKRVSHLLRVRVHNHVDFSSLFASAFEEFLSYHQLESVETVQAGLMTELRLAITLRNPNQISAFLQKLQSLNGNNRILLTPAGSPAPAE